MEDILESLIDYRGKTPQKSEDGIPTLSAKSVKNGYIDYSECYYISPDEYKRFMVRGFPKVGDVLLTTEAPMGMVARLDRDDVAIAQRLITLRGKQDILDNDYLLYYLQSPIGQHKLAERETGSTVTGIKQAAFRKIEVDIPDIEVQRKISSCLACIDAKIETNKRINRNLQEQLKAIFDAWFYKMEPFGGEEPKGTEYIPLEKLCVAVTKGTTPTTLGMSFTDEGINFIKGETILDNHGFDRSKLSFISEDTHEKLKRSQIENGDIVFTIAGTLGRFALVDESMIPANTNQAVAIIRSKCIAPEYLYSFFLGNWHNDYYTKRIQQAVQANLSLGTIKSLPIAVLPKVYYKEYLDIIKPLIRETKRIEAENMKLIELRDSLLPRLMSGELDVSDLDI